MTNEEKIQEHLNNLKKLQENPNFRLHLFEVYEYPDLVNSRITHERYTTKRSGIFEVEDNWYVIESGNSKNLNDLIKDKQERLKFKSSLIPVNYALGGMIFN